MGNRRSCDSTEPLPVRPEQEICFANGVGGAGCADRRKSPPKYDVQVIKNYICTNPDDFFIQEEWIRTVLNTCR